jgi:hypothetical protein
MSRFDRQAAELRASALRAPMTKANQKVIPSIELQGGVALGLSVNK